MSTIAAGTSAGTALVSTGDTTGALVLQTNGTTTAVTIDASQNMGVGNTSPSGYKLAIGDGSSNRGRIMLKGATSGNYPEINIDDTMNSGGKNYQIYSTGGQLKVVNSTDSAVSFVANGAGIGLGDNAPVDGDGIRFPATQSESSDANTLDDYEEGNWTPTLSSFGTAPTIDYYITRIGRYVKVGRQVTIWMSLQVNQITSAGTSVARFTGLPFQSSTTDVGGYGGVPLTGDLSWGSSKTACSVSVGSNSVAIDIYGLQNGTAPVGVQVSNFTNYNQYVNLTITYIV